jgi:putative membrane protein
MSQFIIRLGINAVALGIAAVIVPGISFAGGDTTSVLNVVIVALIFGLVNAVIKPVLALVTCPFYILTLGLFTFVVNALMLMLTSWLVGPRFLVDGFWPAFWGSIIISIVSTVLTAAFREEKHLRKKEWTMWQ